MPGGLARDRVAQYNNMPPPLPSPRQEWDYDLLDEIWKDAGLEGEAPRNSFTPTILDMLNRPGEWKGKPLVVLTGTPPP